MNGNIKAILNDSGLLAAREKQFARLERLFATGTTDKPFFLDGFEIYETDPAKEPSQWVDEALKALSERADRILDSDVFRPLCLEFGPYGVHFVDKLLGAEVFRQDGQWYNRYLDTPIGDLAYPDLDTDQTWKYAKNVAAEFVHQGVELPLFGLPTIASPLNTAVNLYGDRILLGLLEETKNSMYDLEIIAKLQCDLHKWYIENIPFKQLQPVVSGYRTQPHGYGQICGCTTHLVSAAMYRDFIAPLDEKLLSVYPNGGMIHLCGSHTRHIPVWKEMKPLRAVQLNDRAAMDLEVYFNELREDQIIYLDPCEGMSIERALEITKGQRIVIVSDLVDGTR